MSGLHVHSTGHGPDLVLLHGWGMHGGVFAELEPRLAAHFRVHRVDLPGHGRSPLSGPFELPALAGQVVAALGGRIAGPALWAGWSLGGMLALQVAAARPDVVDRLVLVASAPRFSRADDWPAGMEPDTLADFGNRLAEDHAGILQRFLALQTFGEPDARSTLRTLRAALDAAPAPDPAALAAGLRILQAADLRDAWQAVTVPVLLIGGERDRLVHPDALAAAVDLRPQTRWQRIPDAGHAPFVSHPEAVAGAITDFAHGD